MKCMTGIYRINPALFGGILGGCAGILLCALFTAFNSAFTFLSSFNSFKLESNVLFCISVYAFNFIFSY